jgi:hypothetical protein
MVAGVTDHVWELNELLAAASFVAKLDDDDFLIDVMDRVPGFY